MPSTRDFIALAGVRVRLIPGYTHCTVLNFGEKRKDLITAKDFHVLPCSYPYSNTTTFLALTPFLCKSIASWMNSSPLPTTKGSGAAR